jgi:hypothetical protein
MQISEEERSIVFSRNCSRLVKQQHEETDTLVQNEVIDEEGTGFHSIYWPIARSLNFIFCSFNKH